ncbi:MAG: XdhC family protein [Candidatus Electrothrix sp. Rat3]|nr:XdhC family protein [Candidatus Electrothrix rattekaaiensis]
MADITYGTDREVLAAAADWVNAGQRVALVTVVKTWGSSPRPPGSLLVMRGDGRFEGSVSGGCIEDNLIARFCEKTLAVTRSMLISYGVQGGDAARFGLPCGGRLELLLEPLQDAAPLNALLADLKANKLVRRQVCLKTDEVTLHPAAPEEEFFADAETVNQIFGPSWHLLLIGAGQLARYTARIALLLGYQVTVCDPRDEHCRGWQEEGVELICTLPDEAATALADHPRAAVVTLAHDPRVDDMALMEALQNSTFYVGALGSRKTSADRRERLQQLELSTEEISRLHAPVGLDIGSHTPPEIALSIMAEITAARHAAAPFRLQQAG